MMPFLKSTERKKQAAPPISPAQAQGNKKKSKQGPPDNSEQLDTMAVTSHTSNPTYQKPSLSSHRPTSVSDMNHQVHKTAKNPDTS